MRTLSRPMFKMGGPIKEGVMHGIREPHQAGQVVGRLAPIASKVFGKVGNIFKGTPTGQVPGWTPLTRLEKIKSWFGSAPAGKYLAGSPEGRLLTGGAGWAGKAGQKIGSVLKGAAKSPLTVGAAGYGAYRGIKGLSGDDEIDIVTGVMKPGGYPKAKKKGQGIETGSRGDFAKAEREARVNKYLELMGYDRSKKMAVADALIDASKIVSDRGTLDKKNINRELINPIIQATSARFDKPGQIREAVGLMATKAEIEKDISKEKDALAKALTLKQIEKADRVLAETGDFEKDIRTLLLNARTAPNKKTLEQYARLTASKYGEEFFKVEDTAEVGVDGIYMIGAKIIRVKDGEPKQIV